MPTASWPHPRRRARRKGTQRMQRAPALATRARALAAPRPALPHLRSISSPSPRTASSPRSQPPRPSSSRTEPDPAPAPSTSKSHLTPQEAADKELEEHGTKPPPFLSRALGVKEPPRKGKKSREEWRADLLNREKRLDERRHLSVIALLCAKDQHHAHARSWRYAVSRRSRRATSTTTMSCDNRAERRTSRRRRSSAKTCVLPLLSLSRLRSLAYARVPTSSRCTFPTSRASRSRPRKRCTRPTCLKTRSASSRSAASARPRCVSALLPLRTVSPI